MALSDYLLCDVCESKVLYDADFPYDFKEYPDTGLPRLGDLAILCRGCAKTHTLAIVPDASEAPREAEDKP